MKKEGMIISLSMMLTALVSLPAFALPGWNAAQIRAWIKNHRLLAPDYQEDIAGVASWSIRGQREIVGLGELHVSYRRVAVNPAKLVYPADAVFDRVELTIWGQPENEAFTWSRESTRSLNMLKHVYDENLAHDFAKAKLVFKANDYVTDGSFGHVHREKIFDVPFESNAIGNHGEVSLFQGQKFAYEISRESETNDQLTIFQKRDIFVQVDILKHNKQIYDAYMLREARKGPAQLNLDSSEN